MPDIASNIIALKQKIPSYVKLVAVSKTKPVEDILAAYGAGHKIFGENRVQELIAKKNLLPADIEWHLVGHMQSNKVKYIVPFINIIESVDTFRLLKIIDSEASKINRKVDCLLQFHIASETTKFGFSMDEVSEMIESSEFRQLKSVRICGVMGMATFTVDNEQIRKEFRYLYKCYKELKSRYFAEEPWFRDVSMGMSGDYNIAIEEGSTIVRIGSIIFGERK